jgi:hypothetical protein
VADELRLAVAKGYKVITVRLTYLAQSVCIKPNFQGLPWFECDGLGNDELLTLFLCLTDDLENLL